MNPTTCKGCGAFLVEGRPTCVFCGWDPDAAADSAGPAAERSAPPPGPDKGFVVALVALVVVALGGVVAWQALSRHDGDDEEKEFVDYADPADADDDVATGGEDSELCSAFQAIIDLDDQVSGATAGLSAEIAGLDPSAPDAEETLRRVFRDMQGVLASVPVSWLDEAYGRLAEVVPAENKADVVAVHVATEHVLVAYGEISVDQPTEVWTSQLETALDPDVLQAGATSTVALNHVSESACGLTLAD